MNANEFIIQFRINDDTFHRIYLSLFYEFLIIHSIIEQVIEFT
jgi:hypothetical protein